MAATGRGGGEEIVSGKETIPSQPAPGRAAIHVRTMTGGEETDWNAYVARHEDGGFFHRAQWSRAFQDGFGYETFYLLAEREDPESSGPLICGVLPLVAIRSRLFGSRLVSLPFLPEAGVLAEDEAVVEALVHRARALASERGFAWVEYRSGKPRIPDSQAVTGRYADFVAEIAADPQARLKAIPRKQRACVRKSLKLGLDHYVTREIEPFLTLYLRNLHHHGTPAFPRRWFSALLAVFPEDSLDILVVTHQGEPVSAVMSFYEGETVLPYYAGTAPAARRLFAHDYMYWALMAHAWERGCRRFDFGRSRVDSGPYHYKRHWGFAPRELVYQYDLVTAGEPPDMRPENRRYRLFVQMWRKLPFALANRLGPLVVKGLG